MAKGRKQGTTDENTLVRRRGGPRTPAGKKRSRLNAVKYGIFSSVQLLLEGQSREEYESFLNRMHESLQPVGELEYSLVDKLATTMWQQRHLLIAEAGETLKQDEFAQLDFTLRQKQEADELVASLPPKPRNIDEILLNPVRGLFWYVNNPYILDRVLEALARARDAVVADGLSSLEAWTALRMVYGDDGREHLCFTLFDYFKVWVCTAEASEEGRQKEGYRTPEQCKESFLRFLDQQVELLERKKKAAGAVEARRFKLEKFSQIIPDGAALDKFLRYRASLERSFDRTLSQLERLQRMRLGQAVPPPLKVELSRN